MSQSTIKEARNLGSHATVKVCRIEEYIVDVYLPGGEEVERRANELITPKTPSDEWDVVHSEVLDERAVYSDDPDAHRVASWLDAPTAPSEDTYYDDSRHFGDDNSD